MRLTMIKPIATDNRVAFRRQPEGENDQRNTGGGWRLPFVGKIMQVVFNRDKMMGGEFEAGLADLSAQAEKSSPSSR